MCFIVFQPDAWNNFITFRLCAAIVLLDLPVGPWDTKSLDNKNSSKLRPFGVVRGVLHNLVARVRCWPLNSSGIRILSPVTVRERLLILDGWDSVFQGIIEPCRCIKSQLMMFVKAPGDCGDVTVRADGSDGRSIHHSGQFCRRGVEIAPGTYYRLAQA